MEVFVDHYVLGFQVSVHNAPLLHILKALSNLSNEMRNFVLWEEWLLSHFRQLLHKMVQFLAFKILH